MKAHVFLFASGFNQFALKSDPLFPLRKKFYHKGQHLFRAYSLENHFTVYLFWGEGKRTVNLVPLPTSLSNDTVPPNASVIRLTTAKPNP